MIKGCPYIFQLIGCACHTTDVSMFCPHSGTVALWFLQAALNPGSLPIYGCVSFQATSLSLQLSACCDIPWMKNGRSKLQAEWRSSLCIYEPKSNF